MVQAVNGVGLVGLDDNFGNYYGVQSCDRAEPRPITLASISDKGVSEPDFAFSPTSSYGSCCPPEPPRGSASVNSFDHTCPCPYHGIRQLHGDGDAGRQRGRSMPPTPVQSDIHDHQVGPDDHVRPARRTTPLGDPASPCRRRARPALSFRSAPPAPARSRAPWCTSPAAARARSRRLRPATGPTPLLPPCRSRSPSRRPGRRLRSGRSRRPSCSRILTSRSPRRRPRGCRSH